LPPPRPRAELVREARSWPRAFTPFVSRGHGDGGYTIDIRVSPAALASLRDLVLGRSVPAGTSVVAFHSRSGAQPGAVSTYAMRKSADGTWDFLIADSDDRVVASGASPLCARCHAEAPADSLFVPVADERSPSPE